MAKPQITPEPTVLRRIKVRQILPEERERYDELLKERHYLHSARLGGRSMRYVAELEGEWVALIKPSRMSVANSLNVS